MRERTYSIMAAALLMTGALLTTACSTEEEAAIDNAMPGAGSGETIQFSATISPKSTATTRAITTGTDANDKEILNVAWAQGEEIAIYYETTDGHASTTATVESVDETTGVATITATLTDAENGADAKFVYPASLANETGDIDEVKLLSQNGNLTGANGISTKFDAAKGTGTIIVRGSEASVSGTISLANQVCICKFKFYLDDSQGSGQGSGTSSGTSSGTGSSGTGSTGINARTFSPVIIRDGNGHTYTITSDRQGEIANSTRGFKDGEDIYIAMLPVSGKTVSFYNSSPGNSGYNNYIYSSSNTTLTAGKFYRNLPINMVKDANTNALPFKDLTKGSVTAANGDVIYMSSAEATTNIVTIPDGASVTIENVNISATGSAVIICEGTATINLEGANSVTATVDNYPAVQAGGSGTTLIIQGSGSLTATGGSSAAGIGSGEQGECGDITISGGTVTATGGDEGSGIGSGNQGTCEYITINGGIVTAMGGSSGAGIGSGNYGTCGDITISGGTVTANGGRESAGIGGGEIGSCGRIFINGGTVTAMGGSSGAGIGSGYHSTCGNIFILGGLTKLTATMGYEANAPIGKGKEGSCGDVKIEGTTEWTPGTATEHFNFTISNGGKTWTLTKK